MKLKDLTIASLAALVAIALLCNQSCAQGNKKIKGNGNIRSETRGTGDFSRIDCPGSFHIFISQGNNTAVKVEADENLLPHIVTRVKGNTLTIKTENRVSLNPSKPINVFVTVKQLEALHLSGSSIVTTQNTLYCPQLSVAVSGMARLDLRVDGQSLGTDISGTGKIHLQGKVTETEYRISGTAEVDAGDLVSDSTSVLISGIGKLHVNSQEKLNVSISGTGKVWYKGHPSISESVSGIGKIQPG